MVTKMQKSKKYITSITLLFLISIFLFIKFLYPIYLEYKTQSKLSAINPVVQSCQKLIENAVHMTAETQLSQSLFICDGGASSGVSIPKFLKSLAVNSSGVIAITIDYRQVPELSPYSNVITFTPMISSSVPLAVTDVRKQILGWRCGNANDGTTVPAKFLPDDCIDASSSK